MKFIIDECTGPRVAEYLRKNGHDTLSIYDDKRGLPDSEILKISIKENRILITNDKDFGELIFRENRKHCGVIFLRLEDERAVNKTRIVEEVLNQFSGDLADNFIVASENNIRIIHKRS